MDAIRRVAMTGLLIFIPGNHRATFGFALAVASVILYRDASPFLTQSVNVLGSSAQWLGPEAMYVTGEDHEPMNP